MDYNVLQAIKYGHSQILMSTPADVLSNKDSLGTHGQTYLHHAAESGNESILRHLIHRIHLDVNAIDNDGMTPLHYAALESKQLAVNFLLANGAKVDPVDVNNETPLYLSALSGSPQCLQTLIKHSASINHQTKSGNTALHIAIINNNWECIDILSQHDADCTILNKDKKTAANLWDESPLSKKHKYIFTSKKELIKIIEMLELQIQEKDLQINELLIKDQSSLSSSSTTSSTSNSNTKEQQQQQPIKVDYSNILSDIDNITKLMSSLKSSINNLNN